MAVQYDAHTVFISGTFRWDIWSLCYDQVSSTDVLYVNVSFIAVILSLGILDKIVLTRFTKNDPADHKLRSRRPVLSEIKDPRLPFFSGVSTSQASGLANQIIWCYNLWWNSNRIETFRLSLEVIWSNVYDILLKIDQRQLTGIMC